MRTRPWRLGTRAKLLLRGLRYAPLLPFASIDGWLSVDEAIELYELARSLPHERPVVVEVGSWQGRSSVCLARGLHGKIAPRLACIDPFDASGDDASAGDYDARARSLDASLRATFESNLRAAGVARIVDVLQGRSHEHAAAWRQPVDLVFLDGDHAHDAVTQDLRDWAPKVRAGGYLAVHDVVHPVHDGPRRAVDELVRGDPAWVDVRTVDSMFVARRAHP